MTSNILMKTIRLAVLAAASLLPALACTYSASSPVAGSGGGNVALQIYTQPGCAWQVTSGAAWVQIYSTRSGRGNGTVYVYLPPNRNGMRQAYLNVVVTSAPGSGNIPGRGSVGTTSIVYRSLVTEY